METTKKYIEKLAGKKDKDKVLMSAGKMRMDLYHRKKTFVRLAETRVNKTLKEIRLIGNLSNQTNYSYEPDQVAKIFEALQSAVAECEKLFENGGRKEDELFRL